VSKIRCAVTLLPIAAASGLAGWEVGQLLTTSDVVPAVLTILALIVEVSRELIAGGLPLSPEVDVPDERIARPEATSPPEPRASDND